MYRSELRSIWSPTNRPALPQLTVSVDCGSYEKRCISIHRGKDGAFFMIKRLLLLSSGDAPCELETIMQQTERFSHVIQDKEELDLFLLLSTIEQLKV
jgi:hypothetical protein